MISLTGQGKYLKAPANASAVYSPKLRPHVTSTELITDWPSSRARNTSTAARLVTYIAGCKMVLFDNQNTALTDKIWNCI